MIPGLCRFFFYTRGDAGMVIQELYDCLCKVRPELFILCLTDARNIQHLRFIPGHLRAHAYQGLVIEDDIRWDTLSSRNLKPEIAKGLKQFITELCKGIRASPVSFFCHVFVLCFLRKSNQNMRIRIPERLNISYADYLITIICLIEISLGKQLLHKLSKVRF